MWKQMNIYKTGENNLRFLLQSNAEMLHLSQKKLYGENPYNNAVNPEQRHKPTGRLTSPDFG